MTWIVVSGVSYSWRSAGRPLAGPSLVCAASSPDSAKYCDRKGFRVEQYLKSRAAWVTGGVTGMGKAIALALARHGADIAIGSLLDSARAGVVRHESVYMPSENEMESTRKEIE